MLKTVPLLLLSAFARYHVKKMVEAGEPEDKEKEEAKKFIFDAWKKIKVINGHFVEVGEGVSKVILEADDDGRE